MNPFIPQLPKNIMSRYADGSPNQAAPVFPANMAETLTPEVQKQILIWMSAKYMWPQIQERMPFEPMWDKMLEMSRISNPYNNLFANTGQEDSSVKQESDQNNMTNARVSDSVVHDAIERLTDITHFVAFKEGLPCQFVVPEYVSQPMNTKEYDPAGNRVKAGNALLHWNSGNNQLSRNSLIAYRHHYTYGLSFVVSDFNFRVENIARQDNLGQIVPNPEITKIGTSFEPISIRKIWLNWRLPAFEMDSQPCPFWFEETPRFAVLQNAYDPKTNPFGYVNLDKIHAQEWLYASQEFQATLSAYAITFGNMNGSSAAPQQAQILEPKHSVEAKWTLFPMLPLDPSTGEFDMDGSKKIPYTRFIVEMFGPNIHSGSQVLLRVQPNYYPKGKLPIYASVHMPDLDSGAYAPSIGQILYNHFNEITLCMEQFLANKDWINDPPSWVQTSSPALEANLNQKGAKIKVNGPNDFGWRQPYDATGSTVEMMRMLRDSAQTTSKAVDAVLGKAMGGRTSATEASNAFQAAMSGITTDINMISHDLHGNYAQRVWDYSGMWFDKDLLEAITGQLGFVLRPEDMWLSIGIQTNTGSTYIEKIVKQQNYRYILEASRNEPMLDRSKLWFNLLDEMGFNACEIVQDGGRDYSIQLATLQACETYLGKPVIIDPDQDHQVALTVKMAFLKDRGSVWNTEYPQGQQMLMQQIQQHQLFLQLQMQQQLIQQQMAAAQAQLGIAQENPPPSETPRQ